MNRTVEDGGAAADDLAMMLSPHLWVFKHPRSSKATLPVLPLKRSGSPSLGFLLHDRRDPQRPWRFYEGNVLDVLDDPGRGQRGSEALLHRLIFEGWSID